MYHIHNIYIMNFSAVTLTSHDSHPATADSTAENLLTIGGTSRIELKRSTARIYTNENNPTIEEEPSSNHLNDDEDIILTLNLDDE